MPAPREYTARLLQEPNPDTDVQPDFWEFQESSDDESWHDIVWADEFVDEISCPSIPEDVDPDSVCYSVDTWLQVETTWIRARAVEEVPYEQSDWSEHLYIPEPPASVLLISGLIMISWFSKLKKGLHNVK